jgi:hypothetical protein
MMILKTKLSDITISKTTEEREGRGKRRSFFQVAIKCEDGDSLTGLASPLFFESLMYRFSIPKLLVELYSQEELLNMVKKRFSHGAEAQFELVYEEKDGVNIFYGINLTKRDDSFSDSSFSGGFYYRLSGSDGLRAVFARNEKEPENSFSFKILRKSPSVQTKRGPKFYMVIELKEGTSVVLNGQGLTSTHDPKSLFDVSVPVSSRFSQARISALSLRELGQFFNFLAQIKEDVHAFDLAFGQPFQKCGLTSWNSIGKGVLARIPFESTVFNFIEVVARASEDWSYEKKLKLGRFLGSLISKEFDFESISYEEVMSEVFEKSSVESNLVVIAKNPLADVSIVEPKAGAGTQTQNDVSGVSGDTESDEIIDEPEVYAIQETPETSQDSASEEEIQPEAVIQKRGRGRPRKNPPMIGRREEIKNTLLAAFDRAGSLYAEPEKKTEKDWEGTVLPFGELSRKIQIRKKNPYSNHNDLLERINRLPAPAQSLFVPQHSEDWPALLQLLEIAFMAGYKITDYNLPGFGSPNSL